MSRRSREFSEEFGELKAGVKSAHKRLDGMNRRLDGMAGSLRSLDKETSRIAGALELRPATVIPVQKNGAAPEVMLSPEDRAALNDGRAWRGLGSLLSTARKNLLALIVVVLVIVMGYFQLRSALKGGMTTDEFKKLMRESSAVSGPSVPDAAPSGRRARSTHRPPADSRPE